MRMSHSQRARQAVQTGSRSATCNAKAELPLMLSRLQDLPLICYPVCPRQLASKAPLPTCVVCGAGGHARCVQVASAAWPAGWALVPAGSEQVMIAAVLDCACMTGLVPQARCHKPDGAVPARCAWQPLRQQQLCELGSAKNERVVTMNRLHGLHR